MGNGENEKVKEASEKKRGRGMEERARRWRKWTFWGMRVSVHGKATGSLMLSEDPLGLGTGSLWGDLLQGWVWSLDLAAWVWILALPASMYCLISLRQAPYLSSDFLICKTVIDSTYFTASLYSLCFVFVGATNHRPRTLCLQSRWVESVNVECR